MIRILITCLLLSLVVMHACEASATTVSIADVTVEPDGVITTPIMVSEITDYGTGTIRIEYNSSVVHVTGVTSGPKSQIAAHDVNNTIGLAWISASNSYGVSGDIIFADVTFEAIGIGSTPVNLDVTLLGDISYKKIPATISNGSFTTSGGATATLLSTIADGGTGATSTSVSLNRIEHMTPVLPDGGTGATSTSVSAPSTTPTSTPTPVETPSSEGIAGESARSTPTPGAVSTLENEEINTAPTTKPTSNSAVPGFEAVLIIIGLMIAFMILRRCNNQ
jgi:predicted RNA-binding protein with TRAM domain